MIRTTLTFLVVLLLQPVHAQHWVIREYASFAPKSDAVPLAPLFDAPLTDTSITVGPDDAFYLTGSAVDGQTAISTNWLTFWRSTDMKQWTLLRTPDLKNTQARSPKLHFLDGHFWLTLGREGGGTDLLRFETVDLAASGFQHAHNRVKSQKGYCDAITG